MKKQKTTKIKKKRTVEKKCYVSSGTIKHDLFHWDGAATCGCGGGGDSGTQHVGVTPTAAMTRTGDKERETQTYRKKGTYNG